MSSAAPVPPPAVSMAERAARASLLRATEPAMAGVVRHVRAVGAEQALADLRHGVPMGSADPAPMLARLSVSDGERDLAVGAELGLRLVCPGDHEWPPALDDLVARDADCLGLWVRGAGRLGDAARRAVAIVGTRALTEYGAFVAGDLASGLAERGWTVVSGMAYGIDAVAHQGALATGGVTVAVLAGGVDAPYPRAHRGLYERILERGLVVSEHPPGAAPHRARFLVRNRLIAALSAGTVVVEAAARSGARSTARHAGELFRHVMAVPGPVTSAASAGCHQLLRDRPDTVLVTKVDEVIEQVGAMGEFADRVTGPVRRRDLLGPTVSRVFDAVPVRQAVAADRIAATAGVGIPAVQAALAALAVQGLVSSSERGWVMTPDGRAERRSTAVDPDDALPLGWL